MQSPSDTHHAVFYLAASLGLYPEDLLLGIAPRGTLVSRRRRPSLPRHARLDEADPCSSFDTQVGLTHGRQAKKQIDLSLAFYRAYFQEARDLSWPRALELAGRFVPYLADRHADLLADLQGIADGAGVQLDEILALNARSEVGSPSDSILYSCIKR